MNNKTGIDTENIPEHRIPVIKGNKILKNGTWLNEFRVNNFSSGFSGFKGQVL